MIKTLLGWFPGQDAPIRLSGHHCGQAKSQNRRPDPFLFPQQQLADRIGLTQRAYAHWERHPVALRADQLLKLAQALNVSVDDLVGTNGKKKRGTGPAGKMRQLFEAASRLPRSQQQKIAALLEAFIAHNSAS